MLEQDIKNTVNNLINTYNTFDPFEICKRSNIKVRYKKYNKDFKAYFSEYFGHYIIYINSNYTNKSQKILCAHELGHIFLKHKNINNFESENLNLEKEANLFALYMLFEEKYFNMKFDTMNGYLIKRILDTNIKLENS
ncbi:ImmA/IrrE family metallo-endopeptidase [Intestinibacter sp.]